MANSTVYDRDIEDIDKQGMARMLDDFPRWCEEALSIGNNIRFEKELTPDSIVVLGMGGSGVSGDIISAYLSNMKKTLPVYTIKDYVLPKYITKNSLIFAVSYSGNTEETVSAYKEAIRLGARVIAISAGGKLESLSRDNRNTFIKIPSGLPPRLSTPYLIFPMLNILQNGGLMSRRSIEFSDAIKSLRNPAIKKFAKELAGKIGKKIPLIYASSRFSVVAMKWKTDINENTKIPAFYNVYSEFNHNELTSYINKIADFHIIIIRDDEDHPRIIKRMKITKDLFKKYDQEVTEILIRGESFLSKLLSTMYTGLWLAYYLAIAYDTDPTPVEIIEDLKKQLE